MRVVENGADADAVRMLLERKAAGVKAEGVGIARVPSHLHSSVDRRPERVHSPVG